MSVVLRVTNRPVIRSRPVHRDDSDRTKTADLPQISALAALEVSPAEAAALASQLERVLACVATLSELDDASLQPEEQNASTQLTLEDDIVAQSLSRRELLAQAPAHCEGLIVAAGFGAEQ